MLLKIDPGKAIKLGVIPGTALRRHVDGGLNRGQLRGWRAVAVLRRHLGELAVLPHLQHEIGPGIDDPGEADHQRPHYQQDARQIMDVEPAHDARAAAAIGAEVQLPHRRRIDHDAGDDGDAEQDAHQSEKQLARQSGKHVGVQLEHDVGEAAGDIGRIEIGRRCARPCGPGDCSIGSDVIDGPTLTNIAFGSSRSQIRKCGTCPGRLRQGICEQTVEIGMRGAGRNLARLHLAVQQVVDLVMENQRQAGDAQQQHEHRADQARPFMDEAPSAKRSCSRAEHGY